MLGKALTLAAAGNAAPAGYEISRSLRFNSADSAYLNRTPASAGNRKTWTWSGWVKYCSLRDQVLFAAGADVTQNYTRFFADSSGRLNVRHEDSNVVNVELITSALYRDFSAWYHIVLQVNTTEATSTDRIKLYVNGSQVTSFDTSTYPSLDKDLDVNTTELHNIGHRGDATVTFNGYLAEVHHVDGQALTPSDFGETDATTGVWKPKAYTGSYGTNGFYLNFSDNTSTTTLGEDQAGSNDWTLNNFSVTAGAGNDSLVDTPTPYGTDTGVGGEVRGNYATQNSLDTGSAITVSNGNLQVSADENWDTSRATIGVTSGKWYWEVALTSGIYCVPGITTSQASITLGHPGRDAFGWGYASNTGNKANDNSSVSYGATWTSSDVIGVAFDADNGTLTFYKNNVSQGTAFTGLTDGPYFPSIGVYDSTAVVNFGQRPFAYTAPSGFKALCTQNLPEPTVADGGDYFNTILWTGDDTSPRSFTGVGFQPDLVWFKDRSRVINHQIYDAVRGTGLRLSSNATDAEATNPITGYISSFDSDGFTATAGTSSNSTPNLSPNAFVAWNWNAGGSNATNTNGTITSTVRANTTAGFSIVSYTGNGTAGATVGHGLGAAPAMFVVKSIANAGDDWVVYHKSLGATKFVQLNLTNAASTNIIAWNDTEPTSSVFSLGSSGGTNGNTQTKICYAFAEVEGYSKFGSYTGNGSADGPFVYTGFRPAWLLVKRSSVAGNFWVLTDTARGTYNVMGPELYPNASDAEAAGTKFDYLSNGFKLRSNAAAVNNSTDTYIFMAFAENPFKYSLAR